MPDRFGFASAAREADDRCEPLCSLALAGATIVANKSAASATQH